MLHRLEPNHQAALLMLASMAAFTCNDALVKWVGQTVPLWQMVTIRGLIASLLLFGLARAMGALRFDFGTRDWLLVLTRCGAEATATILFLSALMEMPLANVTAILQMLPLTVALGAAVFLREHVGWMRRAAIALGFIGMLLIVRPAGAGFGLASLYALLAVTVLTLRELVTRKMSPAVPSLTVTFLAALSVSVFGIFLGAGETWQPVAMVEWGLLAVTAVLILVAYSCAVMTIRVGEVSAVAPLRYSGLIWALLLGWVVFGDWPDNVTLLGAAIVVLAGVFTLQRGKRAAARG